MNNKIIEIFEQSIKLKTLAMKTTVPEISKAVQAIQSALRSGNKILICGNGGSAADSQHFACEMVGRFKKERKGMAFLALTTDTSMITAWANDYSFDTVFERQVEALGRKNDILFGISTSGNSKDVLLAMQKARKTGLKTIGLLGSNGGKIKKFSNISIIVPSKDTPRVQESHITIIHIICEILENNLTLSR